MLKVTNYYYSDKLGHATTDEYEFQDDDKLEVEINIRYPVRITAAKLKKWFLEEIVKKGLYRDSYGDTLTEEKFNSDQTIDEIALFYMLFQNMLRQTIDECEDEIDPERAKKMYDTLKDSGIIWILSDICNPMRIKKLTEEELNRNTCCGPFPNPNFWKNIHDEHTKNGECDCS